MSRISPGTAIVGIFAVLFGLVGAYAIRKSLETEPVAEAPAPQLNTVPVASIDLEPGRPLTLGDIAIMRLTNEQIRERELPEGYMTNPQQIIGRTLREPVAKGGTFMTASFYPQGFGPTVADRLKPGLRAVTVPIANTGAVSGFASPGSLVDVIFRTSVNASEDLPQTTITLLESVEVLALGQSLVTGSTEPGQVRGNTTVTLAVSPQQAAALKVVDGRGDLMLAVRNPSDVDYVTDPEPQTLESLLGFAQGSPPVTTEIYRGNAKETMSFEGGQGLPPRITGLPVRPRTRQTSVPIKSGDDSPDASRVPPPASVPAGTSTQVIPPAPSQERPAASSTPAVETSTPVSQKPASSAVPLGLRTRPSRELTPSKHYRAPAPYFRVESSRAAEQVAQRAEPRPTPEATPAADTSQPATVAPTAEQAPSEVAPSQVARQPQAVQQAQVAEQPPVARQSLEAEQPRSATEPEVATTSTKSNAAPVDNGGPPKLEQPENAQSRVDNVAPVDTGNPETAQDEPTAVAGSFVTEVFTGTSKQKVTFRDGRRHSEPVARSASSKDQSRSLVLERN